MVADQRTLRWSTRRLDRPFVVRPATADLSRRADPARRHAGIAQRSIRLHAHADNHSDVRRLLAAARLVQAVAAAHLARRYRPSSEGLPLATLALATVLQSMFGRFLEEFQSARHLACDRRGVLLVCATYTVINAIQCVLRKPLFMHLETSP